MDRKQKAFANIDLDGRGLEIGGSHSPLLPKSGGVRVETVDHASRAELVEKYRAKGIPEEMLANIEEVDHIWAGGSLADVVGERGAFDFIICSHVIEHMVDLIGFLRDCESLLKPGGRLSLLIPDKRYCLDLFQPLTSVGMAVEGHHSGARFHPFGTVLDHHAYACLREQEMIAWDSETTAPIALEFDDLCGGSEEIEQGRRQREYVDIHRWRFTPTSFRLLLQDLRDLGYHALAEVAGFDTAGSEFFITLTHSEVAPPRLDRLASLLRINEELRSAVEPVVPAAELRRSEEVAASTAERLAEALSESERARTTAEAAAAGAAVEAERAHLALLASERERAAIEVKLAGVLASRSWRLTAPVRRLRRH